MNIYNNVDQRAAHTLATLVKSFSLPLKKLQPLLYMAEDDLHRWKIRYTQPQKWLSRVYKLEVEYSFVYDLEEEFRLVWVSSKKEWRSQSPNGNRFADTLTLDKEMTRILQSIDMEKVEITKKENQVTVSLLPIPGCFVWTLIPPIHYFVRIQPNEVQSLTWIAKTVERSLRTQTSR